MTLLLIASPSENSLSKALAMKFVRKPVVILNLCKTPLKPCIGCDFCLDVGSCRFDDGEKLFAAMAMCDRLVVASPIYNYGFPAPVKAFLDRCQPFYHNPVEVSEGRRSFMLLTAGRGGDTAVDVMRRQFSLVSGELGFSYAGEFVKTHTDKTKELSPAEELKLKMCTDSFYSDSDLIS